MRLLFRNMQLPNEKAERGLKQAIIYADLSTFRVL